MFSRPSNTPGHGANLDLPDAALDTQPSAYEHGIDSAYTEEMPGYGRGRDGQDDYQDGPVHNPQATPNARDTFGVPHTRCAFAGHENIDPYRWPSIQDSDIELLETALPPVPAQATNHGPSLSYTDSWDVIFDQDKERAPNIKWSLSARERILNATQRRPSLDQPGRQDLQRGTSAAINSNQLEQKLSRERSTTTRNPITSQPRSPQRHNTQVRERKAPPIAYNTYAPHVERAVDSARDISPHLTQLGTVGESRSAAGVDTFIRELKDRPVPSRSGSLGSNRGKESLRDYYKNEQPLVSHTVGRKVSYEDSFTDGIRRQGSRKASFEYDRPRQNNDGSRLGNDYSLFPSQPGSSRFQIRSEDPASNRALKDDLQHHQISPPPLLPNLDFGNESANRPNRLRRARPESHQLFDPQFYCNDDPSHHQQGHQTQNYFPTPPDSTVASPAKNGTLHKARSIQFRRVDGTQAEIPHPDDGYSLRESVLYGELQSWAARTIALYKDVEMTCCQCNEANEICNEGHKEGWNIDVFHCYGGRGFDCNHLPCVGCNFTSRTLRRMAIWPRRSDVEHNHHLFADVKWTWLCCCCGTARRTDSARGEQRLRWREKWRCDGCGMDWSERCPTFLIGEEDVDELNRVASSLISREQRGGSSRPIATPLSGHTKDKGKHWLERVEKAVAKGAERFKKVVTGEVNDVNRPATSRSHRHGREHQERTLRRAPTEGVLRRSDGVRLEDIIQARAARASTSPSPSPEQDIQESRQEGHELRRRQSSPVLGTLGGLRKKVTERGPNHGLRKRKGSMF